MQRFNNFRKNTFHEEKFSIQQAYFYTNPKKGKFT